MQFSKNKSTERDVYCHLLEVSRDFEPPLDSYVDISTYSKKLTNLSQRYEYYFEGKLEGLIAGYLNSETNTFFISNFSVSKKFQSKGLASKILDFLEKDEEFVNNKTSLQLEVNSYNLRAVKFYLKNGFEIIHEKNNKTFCKK